MNVYDGTCLKRLEKLLFVICTKDFIQRRFNGSSNFLGIEEKCQSPKQSDLSRTFIQVFERLKHTPVLEGNPAFEQFLVCRR